MLPLKRKRSTTKTAQSSRGRAEFPKCHYKDFSPANDSISLTGSSSSSSTSSKPCLLSQKQGKIIGRSKYPPYVLVPYIQNSYPVSYTHLRAHETGRNLV